MSNSKKQVRAALLGTAGFTVLAIASAIAWGWGWNVWIPLMIAGYHALDGLLTSLGALRRSANKRLPPLSQLPPVGEFANYSWYGEKTCFGTTMQLNRRTVHIDLRTDRQLSERKRAALDLVSDPEELSKGFETFRAEQMEAQPGAAGEISRLQIDLIGLYSKSRPDAGDVYFILDDQISEWACAIEGKRLFNLYKDN